MRAYLLHEPKFSFGEGNLAVPLVAYLGYRDFLSSHF
jgi:hypothetical protein